MVIEGIRDRILESDVPGIVATQPDDRPEQVVPGPSHTQCPLESQMPRFTSVALRLAVLASFVLALGAPFRWF
jgi:hypothetical protein